MPWPAAMNGCWSSAFEYALLPPVTLAAQPGFLFRFPLEPKRTRPQAGWQRAGDSWAGGLSTASLPSCPAASRAFLSTLAGWREAHGCAVGVRRGRRGPSSKTEKLGSCHCVGAPWSRTDADGPQTLGRRGGREGEGGCQVDEREESPGLK